MTGNKTCDVMCGIVPEGELPTAVPGHALQRGVGLCPGGNMLFAQNELIAGSVRPTRQTVSQRPGLDAANFLVAVIDARTRIRNISPQSQAGNTQGSAEVRSRARPRRRFVTMIGPPVYPVVPGTGQRFPPVLGLCHQCCIITQRPAIPTGNRPHRSRFVRGNGRGFALVSTQAGRAAERIYARQAEIPVWLLLNVRQIPRAFLPLFQIP